MFVNIVQTYGLLLSTVALCAGHLSHLDTSDEIALIKSRLWHSQIPSDREGTYSRVPGLLGLMQQDGRFEDLNYGDSAVEGSKAFTTHSGRLNILSQSFHINDTENEWFQNGDLKNNIQLGYNYITYAAPQNEDSNWYGHQIAVPLQMYPGLVLMDTELSRTFLLDTLNRYWVETRVWDTEDITGSNGGSNFAYRAFLGLVESLLRTEDAFIARHGEVTSGLKRELIDRSGYNEAGVQTDNCLHQHNVGITYSLGAYTNFTRHQIYNGEYNGVLKALTEVAVLLAGTSFRVADAAVDTLVSALLDCHQWFSWNTAFDPTVCGRKITANAPVSLWAARSGRDIATKLLQFDRRRQELENMISRYGRSQPLPGTELIGNKGLFSSDMMVQQRSRYMASVRMLSERTIRPETWPNTPHNPKGYYLGDGFLTVMNHGLEYGKKNEEVFQVYDWELTPGSIVEYSGNPPQIRTTGGDKLAHATGLSGFTGSASSGTYGVAGMTYSRFDVNVTAKKAWVFLDDEIVVMTTNIDGTRAKDTHPVVATVNQVKLNGVVTAKYGDNLQESFEKGEFQFNNPIWLHHDSNAYIFIDGFSNIAVSAQTKSTVGADVDVFTAYTDLGVKPMDERFAYVIKPATENPTDIADYVMNAPVRVVQNDQAAQVAHHKYLNISAFVIYRPGDTITLPTGLKISADIRCYLIIQEKEDFTVSASNPYRSGKTLQVNVNRKLSGEGAVYDPVTGTSTLTFDFAAGRYAGESVVKTFDYN